MQSATFIFHFIAQSLFGLLPVESWTSEEVAGVDLACAPEILANTEFSFPEQARTLWKNDDGLPEPEDDSFAAQAVGFIAKHPVSSPGQRGETWWDTDNMASRQCKCLAYLAAGQTNGWREIAELCIVQAARMQWSFPICSGKRGKVDRTFFSAAGALALTGGLLQSGSEEHTPRWEVATQWFRTGIGQFKTYGAKSDDIYRQAAEAIIDSTGGAPESLSIRATDECFFSELDLERPDMRAVAERLTAGDFAGAKSAYVATLAERFSAKHGWPDIHFWKAVDLNEAYDICRNVFILQAHMFRRYDYGEKVDWTKVIDNDIESRVWMNAHPWMWPLLNAYHETRQEKYVKHLCRLFNSWYEDSPPSFTRTSAQWRTLEVGGRSGQKWGVILLNLAEHPRFQSECLFNMARSMLEHGKYLSMYAAGGGNWLQVEASGLACVVLLFPEFKLSPLFYDVAMNRLLWVNARAFLPDGFQSECSPVYHRFPLIGIASALRLAKFRQAPAPEELMKQYETGVEALEYIAYPDGTLPMLSDVSPQRHSAIEVFDTGAEVFVRDDFRWFATGGKEGKPPTQTSHDFEHAGYCVMRDKWGPDGQMLIFDAGYFGSGHQHEDKLNFVYYAGGRELIGDPGIYSYKRDEFEPYWRGSWSHNTIVVDGLSQHRALGPAEPIPDLDRRFVIGEEFDFAVGWYRRAYSPRGAPLWGSKESSLAADKAAVIRNIQHQRCLFYVKGQYAIICDRVLGEGEHQIDIIFHPAPVVIGMLQNRVVRPPELEISPRNAVVTKEREHANVAIVPVQVRDLQVLDLVGQKKPVRGWFSLYGIQPSHDIVYRRRKQLPIHFETIIQALPPGDVTPMKSKELKVICQRKQMVAGLSCDSDLFLISYDGYAEIVYEDVTFHGTALLLRRDANGRPIRAHMVDGKLLSLEGKEVFSAEAPKSARSIDV